MRSFLVLRTRSGPQNSPMPEQPLGLIDLSMSPYPKNVRSDLAYEGIPFDWIQRHRRTSATSEYGET